MKIQLKSVVTGCLSVVLCMVMYLFTGCNTQIGKQPEQSGDSTDQPAEQKHLFVVLENRQHVLFLRVNEQFEVTDTLFTYRLHEEKSLRQKGNIKIDTANRMCYFFDPVYDEYAERFLSNNLISMNLNTGTTTQIYDFRDFSIGEWEFDFEQNSLYYKDFEKHVLFRYNLVTKKHEQVWHFDDEAPLWHLDMEFTHDSIMLYFKHQLSTREITISKADGKTLISRTIWTTPHPQSNNRFTRNGNVFVEIVRSEPGSDQMTLFKYKTSGESYARKLPYRFDKQVHIEWLSNHIVVMHDQYLMIFNQDLDLVQTHEPGILTPPLVVPGIGHIYRAGPSSQGCFLLKPDLTLSELPSKLFSNVLMMI
jgi:hypothetical protein